MEMFLAKFVGESRREAGSGWLEAIVGQSGSWNDGMILMWYCVS